MKKRIVIAGGTGFIGKAISSHFLEKGYEVVVLSRRKTEWKDDVLYQHWDGKNSGEWTRYINGAEIVVNLTGKSVNCRYTEENKRLILSSRVDATTILGEVINLAEHPPQLWINASTATIYDYSLTKPMTEESGDIGNDFSMSVASAWEHAFFAASTPGTRKVALRISLVLGQGEGVLPVLTKLARLGLGGYHGNGKQKFAWIHLADVLGIIDFVLENNIEGPVNCTTDTDINNRQFMQALRKSLGVPFGMPTPKFAMELGAVVMGTESELLLKSRYVKPKRLLDAGYSFQFTDIHAALQNLK
ncbi:MAG: TIGR01777 family oxidoreductase [Flavobacteriales bacterium]|nr:TIGR01777 family oxidoreductase [Flavobacteriales bacterium]